MFAQDLAWDAVKPGVIQTWVMAKLPIVNINRGSESAPASPPCQPPAAAQQVRWRPPPGAVQGHIPPPRGAAHLRGGEGEAAARRAAYPPGKPGHWRSPFPLRRALTHWLLK